MKDIILLALKYIPQFLSDPGKLLTAPGTFFSREKMEAKEWFVDALIYYSIAMIFAYLVFSLTWPFDSVDIWKDLSKRAILGALSALLLCGVGIISWKIVGWRFRGAVAFPCFLFMFGAMALIEGIFYPIAISILKLFSYPTYLKMVPFINDAGGDLIGNGSALLNDLGLEENRYELAVLICAAAVGLIGSVLSLGWFVWTWMVISNIGNRKIWQGLVALLIFVVLAIPSQALVALAGVGLTAK